MASIRLDDVHKTYATGQAAVRGIALDIADGELAVLVGPSGCGKSTVLRLVAGLETPSQGRVYLGEQDVTGWAPQDRNLAMVFQNYALYPHKNVRENLAFGLRMRGVPADQIAARVQRVARRLGVDAVLERRPSQLSGGQRQRVALGRAMVREPQAFLLDEPLSNLDAKLRVETRAELARIHRQLGATMLYVTHDQEEAMTLGDRIAVLRDGQLQQFAPAMEVYGRPANAFVAGFIGSPAMNLLDCTARRVEGTTRLSRPGLTLHIDTPLPGGEGRELVLGIRPRDVRFVAPASGDALARVDVVEPLGHELLVHLVLEAGGDPAKLTTVVASETHIAVGEQVGLHLRRDRLHLFDTAGRRIDLQ